VRRIAPLGRRHGLDLLIVLAAVGGALEVVLRHGPERPTGWYAAPAVALLALVLLARRRWAFAAPASLWLAAAALSFADGRLVVFSTGVFAAGMAASFLLGGVPDALQRRAGLAIVLGAAAIVVANQPDHTAGEFVFIPLLFAIAWLAGFAMRERSVQAEAAEERAALAERERDAAARVAVAEERARIARELHDIVAHSVSVMVLHVGAVRHNLPPTADREALLGVERTGRAALGEMRRLLGAMRENGADPDLAPQPGLADLDALLSAFDRAGLPVRLRVDGEPAPLSPALDLSAYRVVQEGLTNALKHAHASRADVVVRYGADDLRIDIRDDGHGAAPGDGLGHGLVGIRERVKIYGGEMTARPANGGGFLLSTSFPLEGGGR